MVYDDHTVVLGAVVECGMFSRFFIFIKCFLGLNVAFGGSGLVLSSVLFTGRDKDLHDLVDKLR